MAANARMTILEVVLFIVVACTLAAIARADSPQAELVSLMQENFEACNHENLPKLLGTMSVEMPQRELFIRQTKAEWEASDLYYRLDGLKIVKQNQWRPPYVVATVQQTITGNEGQVEDAQLSDSMGLNTHLPSSEQEVLFKREKGVWKMVACLNEPRPVNSQALKKSPKASPCANGQCRWPKTR